MSGAAERKKHPVLPPRHLLLLLVAVVLVALWRFAVLAPGSTLDDAFILLVYARHFVSSGQLYYNSAEGPLDGFTSPLDLLLKAAGLKLFPGDPLFTVWLISIGLYLAVVLSVVWFAWHALRQQPAGPGRGRLMVLFGLLAASIHSLATGSQFLLETPLYTLIGVWAGYYFLVAQPPESGAARLILGLLLLALPLARPEGVVVAAVCLLGFAREQRWRLQPVLLPALIFALGVAAYYAGRIRYFGYWAPNSYYAKTSASRLYELRDGLHYVASYVLSPALPVMVWLVVCPLFVRHLPTVGLRRRYEALCAVTLAALATVIYGGGDCYGGGRFLALPVTLALLALLQVVVHLPARSVTSPAVQ